MLSKRANHLIAGGLAAFLVVSCLGIGMSGMSTSQAPVVSHSSAGREEQINRLFSGWDGSLYALKEKVKATMNDPESFDHVETGYSDKGDHLLVQMKYRGTNTFGGIVTNSVIAKVDLDGNVLEILYQGQ